MRGSARAFANLFRNWGFYVAPVPAYYGGHMAFGWASNGINLALGLDDFARKRAAALDTRYYNSDVHKAAFALPAYIRDLIMKLI